MSNSKIDQLFAYAWVTTNTNFSFGADVAFENEGYKPTGQTAYAELLMLPNQIDPLTLADMNETSGIFRVILRYPVDDGAGPAKVKADAIIAAFPVNSKITYSGQSVTIKSAGRQPGVEEKGWFKMVVSIAYSALITR